ncbi:hypothetical protein NU08_4099 [Flavobacterium anhuiense]|uniref:Uncharacterized protein n=1 Tax=Flavobacterium anhuiense TaxID=459526 RepID=A0A444VT78_9FLAO|nr:hypothetical protein NU08_4099 [Flavobacterium anhuiense]
MSFFICEFFYFCQKMCNNTYILFNLKRKKDSFSYKYFELEIMIGD